MSYTKLPNYIVDDYLSTFDASELKVLLYVLRRTVGFQKPVDRIPFRQFMTGIPGLDAGTGLGRRQLIYAIQSLEEKRILYVERTGHSASRYGVHWDAPGGALYCTGGVQRVAPLQYKAFQNGYEREKEREILARVMRS